jgi:hypothetical protein
MKIVKIVKNMLTGSAAGLLTVALLGLFGCAAQPMPVNSQANNVTNQTTNANAQSKVVTKDGKEIIAGAVTVSYALNRDADANRNSNSNSNSNRTDEIKNKNLKTKK